MLGRRRAAPERRSPRGGWAGEQMGHGERCRGAAPAYPRAGACEEGYEGPACQLQCEASSIPFAGWQALLLMLPPPSVRPCAHAGTSPTTSSTRSRHICAAG